MPRADGPAGLEVAGRLSVLADGAPLEVAFRGERIDVVFPDIGAAMKTRRALLAAGRGDWARSAQAALARGGLELRAFVGGRQVGRLSAETRSGWLASLLGVGPMELYPRAIVASLRGPAGSTPKG